MGDRCTGHCCRRFTLPWSPRELRRKTRSAEGAPEGCRDDELIQVGRMVIPLGRQRSGNKEEWAKSGEKRPKRWFYTCKNYIDGQCSIYATRPRMCSEYPYGGRCLYASCTWDAVRHDNPAEPPPMAA